MKLIKKINILIVGLGLLGGSYAKGLKKLGFYVSAITKDQQSVVVDIFCNLILSSYLSTFFLHNFSI